jgi:tRNA-dihydrouridine synthase A
MEGFMAYAEEQLSKGIRLNYMTRHILGLYQGLPGARRFRRVISEQAHKPNAGIEVIKAALNALNELPFTNELTD